jgi:hypothetical protein
MRILFSQAPVWTDNDDDDEDDDDDKVTEPNVGGEMD